MRTEAGRGEMTHANCSHFRSFANMSLLEDEGETVYVCPDCRSVRLEGTDIWIPGRYGMIDHLRSIVLPKKKEAQSRDHAAMHGPDNDPRWSRIQ